MDVKRDRRGSSYDHDNNGAKYLWQVFEGLDHFCLGNQDSVIEGLWSFCLICFAKIPSMHTMAMFLRQQVDETLRVLVCIVLSFFMHFCLVLVKLFVLILVIIQTLILLPCIFESNKMRKSKSKTITTLLWGGYKFWIRDIAQI